MRIGRKIAGPGLLDEVHHLLGPCFSLSGDFGVFVYIKIGLLINVPGLGKAPPEPKLFIVVDGSFKDQGIDVKIR